LSNIDEEDPLSIPYLERGQRWLERQEAHSLRRALEDMDLKAEQKLYAAAQQEASELVWKHQNPNAPARNPDAPYDYREHLRKESSHARTASWTRAAQDIQARNSKVRSRNSSATRSTSGGSKSSSAPSSRVVSDSSLKVPDSPITPIEETQPMESGQRKVSDPDQRKKSVAFAEPEEAKVILEPKPKERGRTSSLQKDQGKTPSLQRDPSQTKKNDATEDIKISSIAVAARMASNTMPNNFRNPFSRVRNAKASLSRASTAPMPETKKLDRIEIQRNPPTQSRNPAYTLNAPLPAPPKLDSALQEQEEIKMKDGKEIRSDDIRKATSMSLKDRSPKLPMPTIVSDKRGRPIVSFEKNWKPKEVELKLEESPTRATCINSSSSFSTDTTNKPLPSLEPSVRTLPSINITDSTTKNSRAVPQPPAISVSAPPPIPSIQIGNSYAIPTISINEAPSISTNAPTISIEPPSISVEPPSISVSAPSISVSAPPQISINGVSPSARPLPTPSKTPGRPSPRHASTAPAANPRGHHWTNTPARGSALCANCALPISGRIVSAAGVRFHPECFRCHYCAEGLECVAFYPEPDSFRSERLARINARLHGEHVEERPGYTEQEDGDAALRFYCHLDFHEFFSPRCKSCKTPIEGEVVVACGAEWHVGHFFCAQCGDVCTTLFFTCYLFSSFCFLVRQKQLLTSYQPFDSSTPFVEKDGYAWCINCHTNRYSTKCRKCKKPVTDTVVKALGAEWHEDCFCCVVSAKLFLPPT
jgi:paxillin